MNVAPRQGIKRAGFTGSPPTSEEPAVTAELVTITSLCDGCGLTLWPGEVCRQCSGDVDRWMRWQYGMETRVSD